jgi:6-phosphogluconolactonase
VPEPQPQKARKPAAGPTLVYVGGSKGIHLFRLQTSELEVSQNITLAPLGLGAETPSPSFLELDLPRRLLFAVNELDQFEGKPSGAVSAFSVDPAGKLQLLSQRATQGTAPCHLALDGARRNLLVVNRGGSVAVFPVAPDGKLGPATDVQPRPKGARPNGVALDPASRFVFVCDPGLDQIVRYRLDAAGKLAAAAVVPVKAATGPRHLVFRPDGRFAYVVNERNSTVTAYSHGSAEGTLTELQQLSTVPPYFDGPNTPAEVGVHPNGKFLYVSNRGHNSVVLFAIDAEKGTLTYVEEQGTGGKTPRHFGIEPSAKHMAIVNQDSDTVLASRIDAGNGRLKPSGVFASVAGPTCVKFLPPPEGGR